MENVEGLPDLQAVLEKGGVGSGENRVFVDNAIPMPDVQPEVLENIPAAPESLPIFSTTSLPEAARTIQNTNTTTEEDTVEPAVLEQFVPGTSRTIAEVMQGVGDHVSDSEVKALQKAGVIESTESLAQRERGRANVQEVISRLESGEPLTDEDMVSINEAFKFVDERKNVLTKRDRALGMGKVIGKYNDVLSPQTGIAFEQLSKDEHRQVAEINKKAARVAAVLEDGYGDTLIIGFLRDERNDLKDALYKKGKKLGEVSSMVSKDDLENDEKRMEIASMLGFFKAHEARATAIQTMAVVEYVKPENKITKKEMAVLNDTCALGLLRLEQKSARDEMDKLRRKLGRGDIVNNALGFVEKRVGRFEWIKEAVRGAKAAVEAKGEETKRQYNESVDRAAGLILNEDERRRELRAQMRNYGTERATKAQREVMSYGERVREDLATTLKAVKEKAQVNLKNFLGTSTAGFLGAFLALALSNVAAGAGIPIETIAILSAGATAGAGLIERGYAAFKARSEARKANRYARDAMRTSYASNVSPTLAAA
jgi:hypothetical protein